MSENQPVEEFQGRIEKIVRDRLSQINTLWQRLIEGEFTPKEKLDKIGQPSLVLGLELLIFRSWQAKRATY
jgi:hypothetical protein